MSDLQKEYPPTIISFQDAMRLLQMARDASNSSLESWDACREIAKAFEHDRTETR
jgi:hypothetical protein